MEEVKSMDEKLNRIIELLEEQNKLLRMGSTVGSVKSEPAIGYQGGNSAKFPDIKSMIEQAKRDARSKVSTAKASADMNFNASAA